VPHDTFFFDNNLSPVLVQALQVLGEDVQHLRDTFPPDTPDAVWIPDVARRGWILVTRDKRIRKRPLEVHALAHAKLSAFIFMQKRDPDRWGWVELVVRRWTEMKDRATTERRPFVVGIPERGAPVRLR
jgi:hypothetical protein